MRGFSSEEVESALDRAEERGYLNDREYAREFARSRVERRYEGPARVLAALGRKGADTEAAREAVAECFLEGEAEPLDQAATRWLRSHGWDHDRLARHLNGKGFSAGAIVSALNRLEPGNEAGR